MPAAPRRPLLSAVLAALLGAGLLAATAPSASAADPLTSIAVNEVESNGDTSDWVELVNHGTTPTDVSGLRLKDNDDTRTLALPSGTVIAAGGFLAVDVDDKANPANFGLGASDSIRLYSADGATLIDSHTWTAHAAGTTYGRCPDATGAFRTTTTSTKGAANDCSSPVRLNEIESSGGTGVLDWVELVNPSASPVDASGLKLKDADDTHPFVEVPAGTTIPAGGLLAVDVDTAAGFGLGGSDTVRLFGTDGTTVLDSYAWTAHAAGTTYGRCPNGTGAFTTTTTITRGAANDCGVVAPAGVTFNEVESNGDPVGDWAEVINTGTTAVDISGFKFKDGDDTHAFFTVPAGTTVAPGGYYVFVEADFGFGLGGADSVRLFATDATTPVASYTWATHAATSYGRCPDGTGAFTTTTSTTKGAANDCSSPVRVNEVESSGGTPGDWVELVNNGAGAADVSGWVLRDSAEGAGYTLPAASTIPAGGYLVLDEASFVFGLGGSDSVRLFAADGTTLVDSHTWTAHAATTYGRCPNGTGAFATTQVATKGAANVCAGDIVAGPWPGGSAVTTVDEAGALGGDVSGLAYEGSGSAERGVLWAVNNGDGVLERLVWDGARWGRDPSNGWAAGKALRYPGGAGTPDSEGVTLTGSGASGGVYVATERDNTASGVSRPAILRFDPSGAGPLTATHEWNLTADLPTVAANAGLEGIAWVPDSYLTAQGFKDEATGAAYSPGTYANHGTGLFLVALEGNGRVYAYALDHSAGTFTQVASFASGFPGVMDLHFEAETQKLWVVCDDTCGGRSSRFGIDTAPGATQGTFVAGAYYERPSGMPNLNNEGFTTTPQAECVAGSKPVFWADDAATDGHALRAGTVGCTVPPAAPQAVDITSTPPAAPVVGQTYDVTATGGASGNPVVLSIDAAASTVCSISGATVRFDHPGTCVVDADQAGGPGHLAGSDTQSVAVGKALTATEVVIGPDTLTASVAVTAPGAGTPSGTVTFVADGTPVGTAPVVGGVAQVDRVLATGTTHTVTATYSGSDDLAGSAGEATRTDPAITARVTSSAPRSRSGWYRTPVTVTFTCAAGSSALTTPCPAPVTLSASRANQSVTRTVGTGDGGSAAVAVTDVDIDRVDPKVRVAGVKHRKVYTGRAPKPRCVGTDSLSGVASCTLRRTRSGNRYTVVATAVDRAGNSASTTVRYTVKRRRG
ncbi:lamin tail domain-containing protein [Nocardioides sp. 503]|uniref:lamin tail domain-containing protein n=1 Tax=Nocardioides sp. 503 TaxID=2508326 RepID=UPI001ADBE04B|nr:lamin tail domain-containing protein [Nocardioides sp. 503]